MLHTYARGAATWTARAQQILAYRYCRNRREREIYRYRYTYRDDIEIRI